MVDFLFSKKKRDERRQAEDLLARGDADAAVKIFRQLGHTAGLRAAAEHYLTHNNVKKAAQLYEETACTEGLHRVAGLWLERGNFGETERVLKLIHREVPAAEYLRLARTFLARGDLAAAEKAFAAAGHEAGLGELAERYLDKHDLGNAVRLLRRLGDRDGLARCARAYLDAGDFNRAEKLFAELGDEAGRRDAVARRAAAASTAAAGLRPDERPDPDDPNFKP
ncbi:MAG TPA: hypothetical protein PLY66_08350 [Acidobacteriota bacterium]|nr:hypothetical protein [Acidobacteriota bacterium]HQF87785.1 hypothetical protein [Acidobacteriota bacterium]HQG92501.1 hypothetical protein [Acidobacteriota bacterium]